MSISRRSFFSGLGALVAAPAIVRAATLMPVRGIVMSVRPSGKIELLGGSLTVGDWISINTSRVGEEPKVELFQVTSVHQSGVSLLGAA